MSFCSASLAAIRLLFNNMKQFVVAAVITRILMLLGKLAVVALSFALAFIWLRYDPAYDEDSGSTPIAYTFTPLLLIALISFVIASGFMAVFELAIDTILLCFCEDLRVNKQPAADDDANRDRYFMSTRMRRVMGVGGKQWTAEEMSGAGETCVLLAGGWGGGCTHAHTHTNTAHPLQPCRVQ